MNKMAPYLQSGDTIGIVCPGGFMERENAEACIETLKQWGYRVKIGDTLGANSMNYFSGSDEHRAKDFQKMLDDPEVKAILCGRGGYGAGRIIERIDFKRFAKEPKWIIGYSDTTVFHAHILQNYGISTLHAPMAGAFQESDEYVLSIKDALSGEKTMYKNDNPHPFNKKGLAKGELVGGNLSVLSHLIGTSSELKTDNKILFLEDIGEYLYNIDRMLYQFKRSRKLQKLSGLIIGGFTEMKDTVRPFGLSVYEIINEITKKYDYPVCFDFPVGHTKKNLALKTGITHRLNVNENEVLLEECS